MVLYLKVLLATLGVATLSGGSYGLSIFLKNDEKVQNNSVESSSSVAKSRVKRTIINE